MLIQTFIMVGKQCSVLISSMPFRKTHAITNGGKMVSHKPRGLKTQSYADTAFINRHIRIACQNDLPFFRISEQRISEPGILKREDKSLLSSFRNFQIVERLSCFRLFSCHPGLIGKFL